MVVKLMDTDHAMIAITEVVATTMDVDVLMEVATANVVARVMADTLRVIAAMVVNALLTTHEAVP
jgi:hypothetical protein